MNRSVEFRILNTNDKFLYREIRLECLQNYPSNFGTLLENETPSKELKFDQVIQEENSASFLYGAFAGNELIGICGFTRMNTIKTNHRGIISQLYVRKGFQGKGNGKLLLKFVIEKAFSDKTLELIELGVVNNNLNAINIYSDLGFVKFGQLEKYFKFENNYWGFCFMVLSKEAYFNI